MSTRRIYSGMASLGVIAAAVVAVVIVTSSPSRAATRRPSPLPASVHGRASDASDSRLAVDATNALGLVMLNRLDPTSNAVFSPFSIETALAMLDQGAGGQTAAQIDQVLGHARSPAALAAANQALGTALNHAVTADGSGGPTLNSANDIWLQSGLTLDGPFASTLSSDFGAAPQQVNFSGDPAGAVDQINRWVSSKTDGLIPNLLNGSEVTAATTMVLANAVYLHADWTNPFPGGTSDAAFQTPSGTVQAPFMDNQETANPYVHTDRYTAVGLDYAHSSLQYLAIMPPNGQITSLQKWLTVGHLNALTASLRSRRMNLEMPKFTVSLDTLLNGLLEGLGVTDAFTSGFSQMIHGSPQALTFVAHDAVLEVAQKGTTAAAATAGGVTPTVAPEPESLDVDLNHPFLVIIRDTQTGTILFAARVLDPTAS